MRHWSPSCSHGEAKDLAEKHRGQREDLEGASSNFAKIFLHSITWIRCPCKRKPREV